MYCPNCGKEYNTSDPFCDKCGAKLTDVSTNTDNTDSSSELKKGALDNPIQKADLKFTVLYFVMSLLFVIVPIIWVAVPVIYSESFFGIEIAYSVPSFIGISDEALYFVLILVSPAFLVCFLASLFLFKNVLKFRRLIIFKICSIFGIIASIVVYIEAADFWKSGISHLIFTMILCFVNLAIEFYISYASKKINKTPGLARATV